jgi:uncharacterized protein (TIGR03067 family)
MSGLLCTLAIGCGMSDPASGTEDPALVGTWTGTGTASGSSTAWTFVFTATTADVKMAGSSAFSGTYTVDTTTTPKQLTLTISASLNTAYVGKSSNAIYEVVGNKLRYAGNEPGVSARPTTFSASSATPVFDLTKQ